MNILFEAAHRAGRSLGAPGMYRVILGSIFLTAGVLLVFVSFSGDYSRGEFNRTVLVRRAHGPPVSPAAQSIRCIIYTVFKSI